MSDKWISASAPYLAPRAPGQRDAWSEEAAGHGRKGGQELIFAGTMQAPPLVARALGVDTEEAAVARKRIITLDGEPVELTDTYYPTSVASDTPLASPQKIKGGAVTLLAELGYAVTDIHEDISARMPTADERRLLHLGADEPVLLLLRVHVASDGKPVQVDAITMPSRGRHLSYTLKKQG
ncbi:UTRA domain-containing protein [Streptomyces sp. NBC_01571]|uniref:GntR family transcriptional regulator n=1 Tax=Streptomyces sp. NBC_01571 TaxID=2975883 RepID=UPI00225B53AF|nr:UTRA domain-containing protein [Streptomyces sp. NBC_01571]MCX4581018.1 UTRA domain-containing protein [Streptomyces sp. NBC_01571]